MRSFVYKGVYKGLDYKYFINKKRRVRTSCVTLIKSSLFSWKQNLCAVTLLFHSLNADIACT